MSFVAFSFHTHIICAAFSSSVMRRNKSFTRLSAERAGFLYGRNFRRAAEREGLAGFLLGRRFINEVLMEFAFYAKRLLNGSIQTTSATTPLANIVVAAARAYSGSDEKKFNQTGPGFPPELATGLRCCDYRCWPAPVKMAGLREEKDPAIFDR